MISNILKALLYVAIVAVGITFNGCTTRGTLEVPEKPNSVLSDQNSSKATVYVYRSSDFTGALKVGLYSVVWDENLGHRIVTDDFSKIMVADRTNYMKKMFEPGTHVFALSGPFEIDKQTVNLEPGHDYFIAITFTIFGVPGIEFRTKDDFLRETVDDHLIKIIGYDVWNGYKYETIDNK